MNRSELTSMPEYFDRYINLCDNVTIGQAIQTSIDELAAIPMQQWEQLDGMVYAPGKWTIKDIVQHLIDTERIFSYRALAFARGETTRLPSYEEDDYARAAEANNRTLHSLIDELHITHKSLLSLYDSFSPAMLAATGMGFKGPYSVASIGYMMPGHQRWHFKIIAERYMPLLYNAG